MTFNEFKAEILKRAKEADACADQFERAVASDDFATLFAVIKDNFAYCCDNSIIDSELLEMVKADAAANDIYSNVDTNKGYLLTSDSAKVVASDSATVEASGSAEVVAYDNAKVWARDNANVWAYESATVVVYDNAKVWARDSATVKAYDSATVEASGSAYINKTSTIECKVEGSHVIIRNRDTNEVILGSDLKIKQPMEFETTGTVVAVKLSDWQELNTSCRTLMRQAGCAETEIEKVGSMKHLGIVQKGTRP